MLDHWIPRSFSDITIDEPEARSTPISNPIRINYLATLRCTYDQEGEAIVESVFPYGDEFGKWILYQYGAEDT